MGKKPIGSRMCQAFIGKISFRRKPAFKMRLSGLRAYMRTAKLTAGLRCSRTVIQIRSCCQSLAALNGTAHSTRCLQRLTRKRCGSSRNRVPLVRAPCWLQTWAAYPSTRPSASAGRAARRTGFPDRWYGRPLIATPDCCRLGCSNSTVHLSYGFQ